MLKTKAILKAILWGALSFSFLLILAYELGWLEEGAFAGKARSEYVCSVVMELEALIGIPLALRLFKWKRIERDLQQGKEKALLKWGMLRMLMLCLPMVADTALYYFFMSPAFGYLAIIHAICLMFVYPSTDRCFAETESKEEA